MARYCDGPHVEVARWRIKMNRSSSGQTSSGWCDACRTKMLAPPTAILSAPVAPIWSEDDFELIRPAAEALMKNQKGFTFVEVMIVIAISGILMAIAIPKFADYRAEAYKKQHGVYPEGYRTPAQRHQSQTSVERSRTVYERETVLVVQDTLDYFYDPKTKLCFAHYSGGAIALVPCDTVLPLLTPTPATERTFRKTF